MSSSAPTGGHLSYLAGKPILREIFEASYLLAAPAWSIACPR
jgi:hypothetical protein